MTYIYQLFLIFAASFSSLSTPVSHAKVAPTSWVQKEVTILKSQASNINPTVLRLSLLAYLKATHLGITKNKILTVIDYSKPATRRRLWVFDLENGKTLFNTWVTHGKNSGGVSATSFSNQPGSLKSSFGVFMTSQTYQGNNGYSLRINGLERGVNDKAYQRAIVFHGANYVNPVMIRKYGHIGRSWGCPAVSKSLSRPLINTIKNKTLVFAYYPDKKWLTHSTFLTS